MMPNKRGIEEGFLSREGVRELSGRILWYCIRQAAFSQQGRRGFFCLLKLTGVYMIGGVNQNGTGFLAYADSIAGPWTVIPTDSTGAALSPITTMAFGANRFVFCGENKSYYSFNGTTITPATGYMQNPRIVRGRGL